MVRVEIRLFHYKIELKKKFFWLIQISFEFLHSKNLLEHGN